MTRLLAVLYVLAFTLRAYALLLAYAFLNCYTLAWLEYLRHGRGKVVRMAGYGGNHFGLQLEYVTVHYLPHLDAWWGWRRHVEPVGGGRRAPRERRGGLRGEGRGGPRVAGGSPS